MDNIENEPFWIIPPREYVDYMRKETHRRELQMIEDIETAPTGLHKPIQGDIYDD